MTLDMQRFALITSCIALGSLGLRALFIILVGRIELSPKLQRALSFVPAAIFTGLIVASVHPERIHIAGDPALLRIIALCVAALIAMRTRSILWTILGGMSAMWLLQWLFAVLGR
jgi:branched-subunit amino acid transport protein